MKELLQIGKQQDVSHIVSNKDWHLIRRMVPRLHMTSEEKERFQLQEKGCKVSKKTVQRCVFTKFGLKLHIPAWQPHLTEVMKKKR